MERLQTEPTPLLPLSWTRSDRAEPAYSVVKLPYSPLGWIPSAEIPHHYPFARFYDEMLHAMPDGFVLQNCSASLRDELIARGCQAAPMGAEAVLDLPWRGKRSVRELARRGRRHGDITEITATPAHREKLARLRRESGRSQGVQLRHTERPNFDADVRGFVFSSRTGEWQGAMTLSTPAPSYLHTEQLLRHRDAPVGVMEALITAVAELLAEEGNSHLSLGAVTPPPATESEALFAAYRHPAELWRRSRLSFRLGRALGFAFNGEGLWRFKAKFASRWEPLYLCAAPRLSWATAAGVLQAMGYFDLVRERLLDSLPLDCPLPKTTRRRVSGAERFNAPAMAR